MATNPIGPDSTHVTSKSTTSFAEPLDLPTVGFAPMPAVARVLSLFEPAQLATFIEVAIDLLDLVGGDIDYQDSADAEDERLTETAKYFAAPGPGCAVSDTGDTAYVEWSTIRGAAKRGPNIMAGQEDDEDDPDRSLDESEPDFSHYAGQGAGCTISDVGGCEHDGREPDSDNEREQMLNDVPMLPVVTLNHNIFLDERQPLGLSNLQSSYRTNGRGVRSADSGVMHVSDGWQPKPGAPV